MLSPTALLLLVALPAVSLAASSPDTRTLGQLEDNSWLENIVVRPNGDILATQLFPEAAIYTVKEPEKKDRSLEVVATIPSVQGIIGITEVKVSSGDETYVFVGGNSSGLDSPDPGSFSAWTLTFTKSDSGEEVKVDKISDLNRSSRFANGLTSIPNIPDAVLIADSANGQVGYLNLTSGDFDAEAFDFPEMDPPESSPIPIGVNGIKIHKKHLYFTNSFLLSIFKVPIGPQGYPQEKASAKLVADVSAYAHLLDDFAFDKDGNIFAATNIDNSIIYIDVKTGEGSKVIDGETDMTVAGATAVAFGRTKKDARKLYVSTTGAVAHAVDDDNDDDDAKKGSAKKGAGKKGAKVVVVDLDSVL